MHSARIVAVLAFPVPIAVAVAPVEVLLQPHCAWVVVDHVEGAVPSAIAASRYVHVAFRSSPHVKGVVAT